MTMRLLATFLVLGLAAAFTPGAAQAQIKCWTGADGKRSCGDAPPAGAKVTTVKVPSSAPPPPAASKDAKDAKKGPLTPAEQEQAYRKRQADAEKAAAKAAEERQESALKRENCERARESVSAIQSGQRLSRFNDKGERIFLDEAQMQQELAKSQQGVQQWCN
jgi:type IV secretory pathway VirB10-like protein